MAQIKHLVEETRTITKCTPDSSEALSRIVLCALRVFVVYSSLEISASLVPVGGLFVHACRAEEAVFFERWRLELQADREPRFRLAARQAQPGNAGQVSAYGIDVDQIHRERIARHFTDFERGRRRDWSGDDIDIGESVVEVLADESTDF